MSKHTEHDNPDMSDRPGGNVMALLTKIQRQLSFLEKKVDGLVDMLREKEYGGRPPSGKPYRKDAPFKAFRTPGRSTNRRSERTSEKPGNEGPDKPFYSKFRKTGGGSGQRSRNKPPRHDSRRDR